MHTSGGARPQADHRVLIAGGGVAGLEAMLALRDMVGHVAEVTLLTPDEHFMYRPVTVAEAFGHGEARSYDVAEIASYCNAACHWSSLVDVDANARQVTTADGDRLGYDYLIVATGTRPHDPLPGALVFTGRDDVPALRELLADVAAGEVGSVVFALRAERAWPLPLYELALMTAGHAREHGAAETEIHVVTPEEEPLALFGPEGSRAIRELLAVRSIVLHTSSLPAYIGDGVLVLAGGGRVIADRVVTLPRPEGPRVPGLPTDGDGFLPVDRYSRVVGVDRAYAVGDATTFPLKQGGLAAQQADVAASQIAAALGAPVATPPFTPVLRGLLLTGGAPLYLRSEPQRLPRAATVAIDARPWRNSARATSAASGQALWWPPAKIAGRFLGAYLATARPRLLTAEPLVDRVALPDPPPPDEDDALELSFLLAECDARWGDYSSALSALEAAEAIQGALPPEYEAKRRQWLAAARHGG